MELLWLILFIVWVLFMFSSLVMCFQVEGGILMKCSWILFLLVLPFFIWKVHTALFHDLFYFKYWFFHRHMLPPVFILGIILLISLITFIYSGFVNTYKLNKPKNKRINNAKLNYSEDFAYTPFSNRQITSKTDYSLERYLNRSKNSNTVYPFGNHLRSSNKNTNIYSNKKKLRTTRYFVWVLSFCIFMFFVLGVFWGPGIIAAIWLCIRDGWFSLEFFITDIIAVGFFVGAVIAPVTMPIFIIIGVKAMKGFQNLFLSDEAMSEEEAKKLTIGLIATSVISNLLHKNKK